jgi:hypothetical protein
MREQKPSYRAASRSLICLLVSVAVLAGLPFVDRAQAQDGAGAIAGISGSASLIRDGNRQPLVTGTTVRAEDRIVTEPEARVEIAFRDGDYAVLGGGSALVVRYFRSTASGAREGLMELLRGIVRMALHPGPDTAVEISTRTAIASVRSTEWVVEAKAQTTGVFAVSGEVGVTSRDTGARSVLSEGEGSDVAAGSDPTPVKRWGQKRVEDVLSRTRRP